MCACSVLASQLHGWLHCQPCSCNTSPTWQQSASRHTCQHFGMSGATDKRLQTETPVHMKRQTGAQMLLACSHRMLKICLFSRVAPSSSRSVRTMPGERVCTPTVLLLDSAFRLPIKCAMPAAVQTCVQEVDSIGHNINALTSGTGYRRHSKLTASPRVLLILPGIRCNDSCKNQFGAQVWQHVNDVLNRDCKAEPCGSMIPTLPHNSCWLMECNG